MSYIVQPSAGYGQIAEDDKEYDIINVVIEKDINGVDQQMPRPQMRTTLRRLRDEKQRLQDQIAVLNAQIDLIVALKAQV